MEFAVNHLRKEIDDSESKRRIPGPMIRSFLLAVVVRNVRMQKTIFIAVAGLVGTLLRYWLSGFVARQYGETFPWGTMAVNLIGCFVTGAVFFLTEERFLVSPTVRTVILIGLLGGFTTFSSYGLQTFTLLRDGEFGLAILNVVTSNILGLFMVWVGYVLGRVL
jgi:CrcB protein